MAAESRTRVLGMSKFGDLDACMTPVDVAMPEPERGWVRIRVEAVSVNPKDVSVVENEHGLGQLLGMLHGSPIYPGSDVVGIIEAVGDESHGLLVGQRVVTYRFWLCGLGPCKGAFGEHALVPGDTAAVVRPGVPVQVAAALPCASLTALQVLTQKIRLPWHPARRPVVVVFGASGGTGSACIQLAKALRGKEPVPDGGSGGGKLATGLSPGSAGDEGVFVIAVASAANERRCMGLGADAFVAYDTCDPWDGVAAVVREEALEGVHAWVECFIPGSGPQFGKAAPLLVPSSLSAGAPTPSGERISWMPGKFVSLRPSLPVAVLVDVQRRAGELLEAPLRACCCRGGDAALLQRHGVRPVSWLEPANDFIAVAPEREGLETLMRLYEEGQLSVDVDKVVHGGLAGLPEAVRAVRSKHSKGKVVVLFDS